MRSCDAEHNASMNSCMRIEKEVVNFYQVKFSPKAKINVLQKFALYSENILFYGTSITGKGILLLRDKFCDGTGQPLNEPVFTGWKYFNDDI